MSTNIGYNDDSISNRPSENSITKDDTVITLERHPTQSHTPVYSLTIYSNGTVIYNGIKNVKISGKQTSTIPKSSINELVNEFINIYYFALKDKYDQPNVFDRPIVTTSISMNGKTKTVFHHHGSTAAPNGLSLLENKIDTITNSKQWTE